MSRCGPCHAEVIALPTSAYANHVIGKDQNMLVGWHVLTWTSQCTAGGVCAGGIQGNRALAFLQEPNFNIWAGHSYALHVGIYSYALHVGIYSIVASGGACFLCLPALTSSIGLTSYIHLGMLLRYIISSSNCCSCRLPTRVHALFRYLHEEKHYGTLTLLAGCLAVPLLTGIGPQWELMYRSIAT